MEYEIEVSGEMEKIFKKNGLEEKSTSYKMNVKNDRL